MKTLLQLWAAWGDGKVVDLTFGVGVILIGVGLERIHNGLGFVAAGILLVLFIRPLGRWIR